MRSEGNNHGTDFTKENLNEYLKELGKEYRKLVGKRMPAEIVLVGGAAVLANYGFRTLTHDVDASVKGASAMQDAIHNVANKYNLPYNWLNTDYERTTSYSPKIMQYSKYYKTFANVLTVRTMSEEYLIAMKLCSDRHYKNDLSDIAGILNEQEQSGTPISLDQIKSAVVGMYGSWDYLPERSQKFIEDIYSTHDFEKSYDDARTTEKTAQNLLREFNKHSPGKIKQSNINNILDELENSPDQEEITSEENDTRSWLTRQIEEKMRMAEEQTRAYEKGHPQKEHELEL